MESSGFTISSAVRLEGRRGGLGNPRWMALLAAIDEVHSISAGAKSAGLSYKAAWDAVDAMNNLAGKPVVSTAVGGRGGGGARLTPHGRKLLATYRTVAAQNERFVAGINAQLDGRAGELKDLGRLAMRTSARNHWSGSVTRIKRGAVNDEVELRLAGGDRIVAVVTHESAESLGLVRGAEANALVKASSVMIGVAARGRLPLSARNQLAGAIARVTRGAVNCEIVVALRGGNTVAAVITNGACRQLGLKAGRRVLAVFKASSVIVAVG